MASAQCPHKVNYTHFFDNASSPAELRVQFEKLNYGQQLEALMQWSPAVLLIKKPELVQHVLSLYLHTGGDYDDEFIKWFNKYRELFDEHNQLPVFDEYFNLYSEMKSIRDERHRLETERKKLELQQKLDNYKVPKGKCFKCGVEQAEECKGGCWGLDDGKWVCSPCKQEHKIYLYPEVCCAWCAYPDITWGQGRVYDCPRCSSTKTGQAAIENIKFVVPHG